MTAEEKKDREMCRWAFRMATLALLAVIGQAAAPFVADFVPSKADAASPEISTRATGGTPGDLGSLEFDH